MVNTEKEYEALRKKYVDTLRNNHSLTMDDVVQQLADLRYAIDQSAIVTITDYDGKILYVNDHFCEVSKYSREELIGNNHKMLNSGFHAKEFYRDLWETVNAGNVWRGELRNKAKDGSLFWLDTTIVPLHNGNGKPYQFISIRDDITERKRMEEDLRKSEKTYRLITENTSDVIAVINREGIITYITPSCSNLLHYRQDEIESSKLLQWVNEKDREVLIFMVKAIFKGRKSSGDAEFQMKTRDDSYLDVEAKISPISNKTAEIDHLVLVLRDITTRKHSERMIYHLTHHDTLTGLPNRAYFMNHLSKELYHAKVVHTEMAVLYLDIDRFKNINDSLGHENGDIVLTEVANRIKKSTSSKDFVARLGGDEFAILITSSTRDEVSASARKIIDDLQNPIKIGKKSHAVTGSIGLSMFPSDATTPEELLKRANIASDNVKSMGRNHYLFFNQDMEERSLERILLENELKKAIEHDQFTLDYQPKIDIETGNLVGMEALVRWIHPELGKISPGRFIPIAEETGLIIELGELILRKGCEQNKKWQEIGFPPLRLSINLSTKQLLQLDLIDHIESILEDTGLDSEWLELEVTESAFTNIDNAQAILLKIRELGIHISIDDFGTGYSSFSYLKHLPVNTLKIDALFIRDISLNQESQAIVDGIVDIAGKLRLNVIAEGIETDEQLCKLKEIACPQGQGFYFSEPLSNQEFELYLKELHMDD